VLPSAEQHEEHYLLTTETRESPGPHAQLAREESPAQDAPFDDPAQDFPSETTPFYAEPEEDTATRQFLVSEMATQQSPEMIFSLKPIFLFLGTLVLLHVGLGFYCFSHPRETKAALDRLPLLGSLFNNDRFSAQHVALSSLTGHYQTTKDNYRVFTISGTATNSAPLSARGIQIEGAIYTEAGNVVGRRVIFCGTEIAVERLANLTLREIGTLQSLVPPKQFHIIPGQAIKFLIVFTAPATPIREFSSRVVAAQFGGS
jgi:hypothetical protein